MTRRNRLPLHNLNERSEFVDVTMRFRRFIISLAPPPRGRPLYRHAASWATRNKMQTLAMGVYVHYISAGTECHARFID